MSLDAVESTLLGSHERAILSALATTFAPPESDIAAIGDAIEQALVLMPPHRLSALRSVLRLFGTTLPSIGLLGKPTTFLKLSDAERERLLLSMADSGIAQLRAGFQAFKRLCCFMAYAAVDGSGKNPMWDRIGYPGPRADVVAEFGPLPIATPAGERVSADAVVVGSGAGGGVAAALLAQSGRKVIVLEAGPTTPRSAFSQREAEMMGRLYLDSALLSTDDLAVSILAGSCVGGGTTVNWCTSLPLADAVSAQWSQASGGVDFGQTLAMHYDAVRSRLQVAVATEHNANNGVIERGCKALGWHVAAIARNASRCKDGCGFCGFGCSYGCKRSTAETYLRDAVAAGAQVIANARVERAILEGQRAAGVEATVTLPGGVRRWRVDAPLVVIAAGSLRSPGILARSGVRMSNLGRHLRLHPTTAIFATFDEPIETWRGPMQTAYSDQFADIDNAYGAKLEVAPAHPGLSAQAIAWRGRDRHAAAMRDSRNAAALIVLTRDRGEGSIGLDERADVRYRLSEYDGHHMMTALVGAVDVALGAGARRVMTLHADPLELPREAASAQGRVAFADAVFDRGCQPNRIALFSAHQMGTCRMHRDPRQGIVDEYARVHGYTGLTVADASVFPLSSGVNPMLTIMALAHRSGSYWASAPRI